MSSLPIPLEVSFSIYDYSVTYCWCTLESGCQGRKKEKKGENVCKLFNGVPFITPLSKALFLIIKNSYYLCHIYHTSFVINSIQLAEFILRAAHKKIAAIYLNDTRKG